MRRSSLALLGIVGAYVLAFAPVYFRVGEVVTAMGLVPITAAGVLMGWRSGLFVALLLIPLNLLLFNSLGAPGLQIMTRLWPGALGSAVVGITIGALAEALKQMKKQSRELARHYEMLQREIGERRQAEKALKESEEKYRSIFAAAKDAIIVVDYETDRILDVNRYACSLYGYTLDEMLKLRNVDLSAEPDKMISAKSARVNWIPLCFHTKKDGVVFPVEVSVSYHTQGGRFISTSVIRDITKRIRAEEERKQYVARLERSNRDLQDFALIASHDLQEPLRKIQAFADRIRGKYSDVLDEQGQDYLGRMQGSAHRMQNLIQAVLDYSRVANRTGPFRRIDLNVLIREVIADLNVSIKEAEGYVESEDLPVTLRSY